MSEAQADTFPKLLIANAERRGNRVAIREKEYGIWQSYTWRDSLEWVRSLAVGLAALGFERGDKAAIVGDNRPQLYWAMAATQALGGAPVPLYQDSIEKEMQYVIDHAEERFAIVEDQEQVDKLLRVMPQCPRLEHIVYEDPRGLTHYTEPFLLSLTTTLKSISGLLRAERGDVTKGAIEFLGERIHNRDAADIVRRGIVQVMEGRRVFEHLTVEENLLTGAYSRPGTRAEGGGGHSMKRDLDLVYTYFPKLAERRDVPAGYVSGGEQQMLAIGRALMAHPRLMLLDEPSMGLAPMLVQEIFEIVSRLNREEEVAILLAEQNARMALRVARYGYVMENGRIVLDADAKTISENEDIREFYLGLSSVGQRKSYRDVKHYRRRKRWLS
jgi:branched-chain amino acid transport system ATP-binding protein